MEVVRPSVCTCSHKQPASQIKNHRDDISSRLESNKTISALEVTGAEKTCQIAGMRGLGRQEERTPQTTAFAPWMCNEPPGASASEKMKFNVIPQFSWHSSSATVSPSANKTPWKMCDLWIPYFYYIRHKYAALFTKPWTYHQKNKIKVAIMMVNSSLKLKRRKVF